MRVIHTPPVAYLFKVNKRNRNGGGREGGLRRNKVNNKDIITMSMFF